MHLMYKKYDTVKIQFAKIRKCNISTKFEILIAMVWETVLVINYKESVIKINYLQGINEIQ